MRKRLLAAIMAMMLTFTLVPATGAAEGKPADRIMNNAYRSEGDFEPSALRKPMGAVRAGALPSSYSSVEQGYLTQVKDQNPYGTCWTFAALAASEADAIKNEGADASNLDLSELHLAYFSYSKKTDPLGGLDGDAVRVTMGDFLNIGGNNNIAINTLANWTGAADESIAPYGTASTTMTIDEKVRLLDKYHLRNAYVYALPNDADAVKQAVMKYGAAATSIWYDMSNGYNGQYLYQNAKTIENHAVTIVGWDDTISKTLFNPDQPKNNGAWLVRNSWGSSANDGGYFWLSYEDTSIHSAAIYDVQAAGTYDRNYQYDGGIYSFYYNGIDAASNIFTAKYSETLKAIGVTVAGKTNTPYDVKIYKKPKNGEPDSGTLVSQASGLFNSNGFYTIDLNQDVELMPGDRFSVVISTQADVYADMDSGSNVSWFSSQTTAYEGQSYFKYDGSWRPLTDVNDKLCNYRIKAFTVDRPGNVDVMGISLPGAAEISVGGSKQLTATIQPTNATNKHVKWSSSNSAVAVVSADGVVSGLAVGTAVITARTYEGSYSASCTVTVKPVGISGVSLSEGTLALAAGQTKQLVATVQPANAANKEVSWSSSNPSVATVNANGLVTAKAAGTTVITATTADGEKTAACTVTVTAKIGTVRTVGAAKVKITGAGEAAYTAPKSKTAKSAVIPATVKLGGQTYKVTSVAANAFKNNKRITKVTIGKNITTIGRNAFYGCSRLTKMTMGKSVKVIGDYAFYGNKRLKAVSLPASIGSIGKNAFRGCTSLTKIPLGRNVKKIGTGAFYGDKKLKTIVISSAKLKSVGK